MTGHVEKSGDYSRQHVYELYAFIVHEGRKSDEGHYYALIRHKTQYNTWYKFDDETVTEIKGSERFKNIYREAYILFY